MNEHKETTQDDIFNRIMNTPDDDQEEEIGFTVFNHTDGFFASQEVFKTKELAADWIVNFRNQYRKQGFYSTSDRTHISPDDIDLEILDPNFVLTK